MHISPHYTNQSPTTCLPTPAQPFPIFSFPLSHSINTHLYTSPTLIWCSDSTGTKKRKPLKHRPRYEYRLQILFDWYFLAFDVFWGLAVIIKLQFQLFFCIVHASCLSYVSCVFDWIDTNPTWTIMLEVQSLVFLLSALEIDFDLFCDRVLLDTVI